MYTKYPKLVISTFAILALIGTILAFNRIKFSFDFEQFFPSGDEDLEFFLEFKEKFEPDDNFLLVAVKREAGVFNQDFLSKVLQLSLDLRRINYLAGPEDSVHAQSLELLVEGQDSSIRCYPILSSQCLLQFEYPVRNPFTGFSTIPAIHLEQPELYPKDSLRIVQDERIYGSLISEDCKTLVVVLKTVDNINQKAANLIIDAIKERSSHYEFEEEHILGRAFFQTEIVKIQVFEFFMATFVSVILVIIVLFFLFRKFWGIIIALVSILVGLLMFTGMLGLFARTMDTMALLYPIIMIIVATSDVIHVMSKYIDELQKGKNKMSAIQTTIKEIGMAIFLTSTTTAIGFLSLSTSRLIPIQQFGINAAIGVMIAYVSVIIFTTTVLALFPKEQIIKMNERGSIWTIFMQKVYHFTKEHPRKISGFMVALVAVCLYGISLITTNTQFKKILPKKAEVTEDFLFFEKEFSGFRPFEIAVEFKQGYDADSWLALKEMDKLETYFKSYPSVKDMNSVTALYKSLNRAYHANKSSYYRLPKLEKIFKKHQKFGKKVIDKGMLGVLVSRDKKQARISAKVLDIGADNIKKIKQESEQWIQQNIDPSIMTARITGTGIIIDKNSDYVRDSLIQGLLFAILLISIVIAFIYRNIKMLFIALLPNLLPLMIAAAIIGFLGIALEAGVAIVFAIIFGIAIDDTIHLLSKFKLCKSKGMDTETAIQTTLTETGKAICLTTVILFFGFLSLFMSSNPPAITVGLLISSTLLSALICDVLIIPVMLRKWIP